MAGWLKGKVTCVMGWEGGGGGMGFVLCGGLGLWVRMGDGVRCLMGGGGCEAGWEVEMWGSNGDRVWVVLKVLVVVEEDGG